MTSKAAAYQSEREPWPYMPAHLGSVADSAQSTINREYSESYYRHMNRFNSLPVLDAGDSRGTLIKIKDEKPKGIMKRRELDTKEQMMYPEDNKYNTRDFGGDERWEEKRRVVQSKPQVTETVQKIEEHKRTEEIERRVQRKERKEKRHRSSHRNHHGGYTHEALGWSDGELNKMHRKIRTIKLNDNQPVESTFRGDPTRRTKEYINGGDRIINRIYNQRVMTAAELNDLLRNTQRTVEQAYRDIRYRTGSASQRNGYLPSNESYYRTSTTRREKDAVR
ncbi:hypothetical protein AB6A40_010728 [Gnathostoma spinigerum]|uniref:Uncharacterized protein n=1 Tax=Gnathostoma spinigerum TaxID=75299 RepID=A0ABD6F241_9BILA